MIANRIAVAWCFATLIGTEQALGQGSFQNLDFESAQVVFDSTNSNLVATTNAIPGWSALSGVDELSVIPFGIGGFSPPVALVGTNEGAISGEFSVFFSATQDGSSISQTGFVPADAQSIMFKAWISPNGEPLQVSVDGEILFYTPLLIDTDYSLYGADISTFAGQMHTMQFTAVSAAQIDDIEFSAIAIPEPSAVALIVVGAGLLVGLRTRRRTRSIKQDWP